MGTNDGSIMASIINVHMGMNGADGADQVWPRIVIQVMEMVQPPGMGMPPDIEEHQEIVPTALAMNRSAVTARNTRSLDSSLADVDVIGIRRDESLSVVLVVSAHPDLVSGALIAPLMRRINIVVSGVQQVDAARIRGVSVEHAALFVLV